MGVLGMAAMMRFIFELGKWHTSDLDEQRRRDYDDRIVQNMLDFDRRFDRPL
jgi:hypothetical protein